MKILKTKNMPKSNGHYSQCIEHNGLLYFSGQLPIDPATKQIPQTIEAQTVQVLTNIETLLKEAGSSKSKVLQARIYVSNIDLWNEVDEQYKLFFGAHKPVRCIIPTRGLHFGCLIEIEVTATLNN